MFVTKNERFIGFYGIKWDLPVLSARLVSNETPGFFFFDFFFLVFVAAMAVTVAGNNFLAIFF